MRKAARFGLWALLGLSVACSDTRSRPVPPQIALVFDSTQIIRSPGLLVGSVNIVATGGLDFIRLTLATGTDVILLDSLEGYAGEQELMRPIQWMIPPGVPTGTALQFRVLVRDFVDFEAADTLELQTVP